MPILAVPAVALAALGFPQSLEVGEEEATAARSARLMLAVGRPLVVQAVVPAVQLIIPAKTAAHRLPCLVVGVSVGCGKLAAPRRPRAAAAVAAEVVVTAHPRALVVPAATASLEGAVAEAGCP